MFVNDDLPHEHANIPKLAYISYPFSHHYHFTVLYLCDMRGNPQSILTACNPESSQFYRVDPCGIHVNVSNYLDNWCL